MPRDWLFILIHIGHTESYESTSFALARTLSVLQLVFRSGVVSRVAREKELSFTFWMLSPEGLQLWFSNIWCTWIHQKTVGHKFLHVCFILASILSWPALYFCDDITCWRFRMYNSYGAGARMPLAQLHSCGRGKGCLFSRCPVFGEVEGRCQNLEQNMLKRFLIYTQSGVDFGGRGDDNGPGTSRNVGHGRFNATASEKDTWEKMPQSDLKHFVVKFEELTFQDKCHEKYKVWNT